MSKEKIIGLSVIGVLTATLAGVTAWRMLGTKDSPTDEAAAAATDGSEQADADKTTGPTVLASASAPAASNDSLADRLAGKTKISGGWDTAKNTSSAPVDPTLPSGTSARTTEYAAEGSSTSLHPSYMPRETATAVSGVEERYSAEVESADTTSTSGELAENTEGESYRNDAALAVPQELGLAAEGSRREISAESTIDDASNYAEPANEAIRIVESDPLPRAELSQQIAPDPAAEQVARRAADDARMAQALARNAEAVKIAGAALEPQPTSAYAANAPGSEQGADQTTSDKSQVPPARFTADSRFTADARYSAVTPSEADTPAVPERVTPTEATVPSTGLTAKGTPPAANGLGSSAAVAPRAGFGEPSPAVESYGAQPSYRDSVYREPAAATASSVGGAQVPASGAYPTNAGTFGTTPRATAVSTGGFNAATTPKQVPQRENTVKYYVEPGDSFWIISQKVYGNGGFFKALQEHNRARILTPSALQVGDEILTPTVAELRELYSGLCPKVRIARPGSPAASDAAHLPVSHVASVRNYEVQAGDTLFDIARYELGDARRWPEIYQLNRVALGNDIDFVKPGTRLVLPMDAPLEASPGGSSAQGADVLTRQPGVSLQR